ncbi:MAG TPA: transposase, partial [Ktedonobacterales bacterium]|nr:transposase [Ktedonobacterales bacterium]
MSATTLTTCRKTSQYKLAPTPTQEQALDGVLWACRTVHNTALEERKTAWERCHVSLTRFQQEAELKGLREAFPELAAIHSHVLQDVLARLDRAFQAFFRRVKGGTKAGEKPGYPRFQGRGRYHSFTYKEYGNGVRLEGNQEGNQDNGFLVLSKIGRIAVRWSRPIQGTPKTVTISREADGWYVSFSCDGVPIQPLPLTGRETGIDVGLKVFLVTAQGLVVDNPRHFRTSERRLAKADKAVARCQKGSHGRRKALARRAKAHQKVKRQRLDFHHKTALALIRQYDTIYLEELQVANMIRNRHLSKSIADAGWRQFRTILAYKAACAGKRVEAIPAQYTSQECSGCGELVPKSLSV